MHKVGTTVWQLTLVTSRRCKFQIFQVAAMIVTRFKSDNENVIVQSGISRRWTTTRKNSRNITKIMEFTMRLRKIPSRTKNDEIIATNNKSSKKRKKSSSFVCRRCVCSGFQVHTIKVYLYMRLLWVATIFFKIKIFCSLGLFLFLDWNPFWKTMHTVCTYVGVST